MKYLIPIILLFSLSAQAKTDIFKVEQGNVAAGATLIWESQIVPSGKVVRLKEFGGADPAIGDGIDSIIALQWGNSGSWATVRVVSGTSQSYTLNRDFTGNGVKKFRVVRMNKSVSTKILVYWIEALIE